MELEELWDFQLEQAGVKGMKWGKRKSVSTSAKEPSRLRKQIASNKREISSLKNLKDSSKMTDAELRSKTERLRNENNLKRLTKADKPGLTKKTKAKQDIYYDRAKLSDDELKTKIGRLQLESNLKQEVKSATKTQREVANKVIKKVAKVALSTYTDANGKFSATGNANADIIISAALTYGKDKNVLHMTLSELEHAGVKGMKWGKRKAAYMSKVKEHESKTKTKRAASSERTSKNAKKVVKALNDPRLKKAVTVATTTAVGVYKLNVALKLFGQQPLPSAQTAGTALAKAAIRQYTNGRVY